MKIDIPWVPFQPSPASISACTSPGTAARLSPVKGHQAAGLIQPQICSTALLSQSPDHKQPGALFGENLEKVLLTAPLSPREAHRVSKPTLLPPTLLTHVLQGILSAIILLISHQDIDIFAAGPHVLGLDTCGFLV